MDDKDVADDVRKTMGEVPAVSDLDDGETITRKLNWFNPEKREDVAGWTIEAICGLDPTEWTSYVEENVKPDVDIRYIRHVTGTKHVGYLTIDSEGQVVDHEILPQMKTPNAMRKAREGERD